MGVERPGSGQRADGAGREDERDRSEALRARGEDSWRGTERLSRDSRRDAEQGRDTRVDAPENRASAHHSAGLLAGIREGGIGGESGDPRSGSVGPRSETRRRSRERDVRRDSGLQARSGDHGEGHFRPGAALPAEGERLGAAARAEERQQPSGARDGRDDRAPARRADGKRRGNALRAVRSAADRRRVLRVRRGLRGAQGLLRAAARRVARRAERNRAESAGRDAGGAQCGAGPAVIARRRCDGDGDRVQTAGGGEAGGRRGRAAAERGGTGDGDHSAHAVPELRGGYDPRDHEAASRREKRERVKCRRSIARRREKERSWAWTE